MKTREGYTLNTLIKHIYALTTLPILIYLHIDYITYKHIRIIYIT